MYWFYKARWYLGVFCVLALAIGLVKWSSWLDMKLGFGKPRAVAQRPAQPAGPSTSTGGSSATTTQPASPAPVATDVRVQLSQAKGLLSEASIYASEALKEVLTWQHDVEPLRERVVAESIAEGGKETAQSELIRKLAYVMRRERMSPDKLNTASAQIQSLRRKVDKLTQQSNPTGLSTSDMAEVSQLHAKCKNAHEDWERDVQQALAIGHLIDKETVSPVTPASPPTLGKKIDDADAEAAVADLDEQIELEKEQEEKEQARAAKLADEKRRKEQEEAELLASATSPEVKSVLAPFLHVRDGQPRRVGGGTIHFRSTFEAAPMSLGALKRIGALEPSEEGLKWLARVGGSRRLSAPRWTVASQPNNWSADDKKLLKDAQRFLRDYGPILVKAGLLSE